MKDTPFVPEITRKHFEEALNENRPSLSVKDVEQYLQIAESVKKRQPQKSKELPGYI